MGDKYYKAIQWLKKNPTRICESWMEAYSNKYTPGSILFKALNATHCGPGFGGGVHGGCLTTVKLNNYNAPTPELTAMIRADDSIPRSGSFIELKHLPIFAKYQRLADKAIKAKNSRLSV